MYNKGTCSGEGCVFSFLDLKTYSGVIGFVFLEFAVSDHVSDIDASDQVMRFIRFGSGIELTFRFICSKMKYR